MRKPNRKDCKGCPLAYFTRSGNLRCERLMEFGPSVGEEKTIKKPKGKKACIEMLAELEHEQWCQWAHGIASTEDLSEERVLRWNRLLTTPYSNLTEEEKEQDRVWARKAFKIFKDVMTDE